LKPTIIRSFDHHREAAPAEIEAVTPAEIEAVTPAEIEAVTCDRTDWFDGWLIAEYYQKVNKCNGYHSKFPRLWGWLNHELESWGGYFFLTVGPLTWVITPLINKKIVVV